MNTVMGRRVGWTVINLLVVLYALIPVLWIISLSFKPPGSVKDGKFIPTSWTWENYTSIFDTSAFTSALINSIVICLLATVISVALATLCAYAISRLKFPGKGMILFTALTVSFFPVVSLVTPIFNVWRTIGLFDTIPGLVIPYLSLTLPLAIWTLTAFFQQIPWEM